MGTAAASELVVAGQVIVVRGARADVAAACRARQLTQDDGMREMVTVDGDTVTFNVGAVAMIREAAERADRGAFGFARALAEVV